VASPDGKASHDYVSRHIRDHLGEFSIAKHFESLVGECGKGCEATQQSDEEKESSLRADELARLSKSTQ
jgi:hypothetical protein